MENNKKSVFEVGDKVYDHLFGWGVVTNVYKGYADYPVVVGYSSADARYTLDGRYLDRLKPSLSFTEYTLEGFSQERPEELPEKGQIVWVKDYEDDDVWLISHFVRKDGDGYCCTDAVGLNSEMYQLHWKQMTTKNPYKKDGE
jgi:hypothetical protein